MLGRRGRCRRGPHWPGRAGAAGRWGQLGGRQEEGAGGRSRRKEQEEGAGGRSRRTYLEDVPDLAHGHYPAVTQGEVPHTGAHTGGSKYKPFYFK